MVKLRIECPTGICKEAKVFVDDKDITSCLYGLDLRMRVDELHTVTLYAYAHAVDVVGDVRGVLEVRHLRPDPEVCADCLNEKAASE